eukprot:Pompholyxophrys_punicea_v1_NODE_205_length_2758_cov_6.359230.p2 type:complete len:103 gc:universal NODE_205_length_2758_cov_6.359230:2412-2720(+)
MKIVGSYRFLLKGALISLLFAFPAFVSGQRPTCESCPPALKNKSLQVSASSNNLQYYGGPLLKNGTLSKRVSCPGNDGDHLFSKTNVLGDYYFSCRNADLVG